MQLHRLHIHCVRNLQNIQLALHPQCNVFIGKNGSGKTSILEAIYLLALGRSFRSRQIQSVINYDHPQLACYGELAQNKLGVEKNRQGEVKYKIGGELCTRLSQFASILPVQLITPDTFSLLTEGSEQRRKFLDWGVFYTEPHFAALSQRYQRLLKQRNAALKQHAPYAMLSAWDKELSRIGEELAFHRQNYLVVFWPFVEALQKTLLPQLPLQWQYSQGWDSTLSLEDALQASLAVDQKWGYTRVGPHRAEMTIKIEKYSASQVLSRGQLKLLICLLHIAQAQHLSETSDKKCIYLLDDLASELDEFNRQKVLTVLASQGHQLFFTGTDREVWENILTEISAHIFEVAQGDVNAIIMPEMAI